MTLIPLLPPYLDHGYKRHDPLHVFLQFRQGSQFTCNHLVVWKGSVVALDRHQEKNYRQGRNMINGKGDRNLLDRWYKTLYMLQYSSALLECGLV